MVLIDRLQITQSNMMKNKTPLVSISIAVMLLWPLASYSETSIPPQPVGTAECGTGGRGGTNTIGFIQEATLEPRLRGYDLRMVILSNGQPEEYFLELDNNRVVESARTIREPQAVTWSLAAYNGDPVEIQSTGEFNIGMMVSTRSYCRFSGTLEFVGNTRSQLFPASATPRVHP
jgi:hypothetical protein